MKKGLILLLAALMLAVMLTACAATQPYYDGYSNVSTTRNGYAGTYNGMYNGSYQPNSANGYTGYSGASGHSMTGSTAGTTVR